MYKKDKRIFSGVLAALCITATLGVNGGSSVLAADIVPDDAETYVEQQLDVIQTTDENQEAESEENFEVTKVADLKKIPQADIFNVDFADGTTIDKSPLANKLGKTVGNPRIEMSDELHKNIAVFDGKSAYMYPFSEEKYNLIKNNITIECMAKFNYIPDWEKGEYAIFSNQQGGGVGFEVYKGKIVLYAHVGGTFRKAETEVNVREGVWYHLGGVVEGNSVKLYVNGVLADQVEAEKAGIAWPPENKKAWNMTLGADSNQNNGVQFMSEADLSYAKIYSNALSAEQLETLSKDAFEGTDIVGPKPQDMTIDFVSSESAVQNTVWNLNLHTKGNKRGSVDSYEYDIIYDPEVLTYEEVQNLMSGVTITQDTPGKIHVASAKEPSIDDFRQYKTTRLGKLNFQIAKSEEDLETIIKVANFKAFSDGEDVTAQMGNQPAMEKTLLISAGETLDLNGDGVVGVGDVALASDEQKESVAQNAAIYPYKHVVVLTIDGGGQIWNPESIYYTTSSKYDPQKTTDSKFMEQKRKNIYAMDLMNKEFATSYTAQSIDPPISAQNYFSILHGVPWKEVPKEYQLENQTTADMYFADFGKEQALYPSVFEVVEKAYPARANAAFTEWAGIVNGIIEPDAQVAGTDSEDKKSFYDVADYIRSDAYKNTAIVYMQSDWLDHVGHSEGYFTDAYWEETAQYDDFYKSVVDALKETGEYDETLIISNADHGGHRTSHGNPDYKSDMEVFISIGGQTVDSGRRLNGGTNADISPLALAGLRIDQPESMTGDVFDKSAFLKQEEMSKKNRDIEEVNMVFDAKRNRATLKVENLKNDIKAIDAVISLNGAELEKVNVANGKVLRSKVEGDKLFLTVSYDKQAVDLADLTFKNMGEEGVKVDEIMLGTSTGKEIYPDLTNSEGDLTLKADKSKLEALLGSVKDLDLSKYTEESVALYKEALEKANKVMIDETLSEDDQDEVKAAVEDLTDAINGLEEKDKDDTEEPSEPTNPEKPNNEDNNGSNNGGTNNSGNNNTGATSDKDNGIPKTPKTGDESSPEAVMMLLLLTGGTLVVMNEKKRKSRE